MAVLAGFLISAAGGPLYGADKPPGQSRAKSDCASCHGQADARGELKGREVSVYVDPRAYRSSVHADLDCVDCHTGMADYPHEAVKTVSCASCHAEAQKAFDHSLHAGLKLNGGGSTFSCAQCHGDPHAILASDHPGSRTRRENIPATCGACHGEKFVMEPSGLSTQPFFSYQKSVHGKAVAGKKTSAAVCTDCHRSHEIRAASDPQSPISRMNVPKTCGACHAREEKDFSESIHGAALRRGSNHAPACTDCHGIHLIKSHIDADSPVAAQSMARTTCGQCHEGVRLSDEFGVATGRVNTYLDSYHGLASRLDSKVVANCASCHGVHKILPSSDPQSMVNKANLVKTCGQCHPGVGDSFAQGPVHLESVDPSDIGTAVNNWVRWIYRVLIVVVVGGLALHNILDFRRKIAARHPHDERWVVRMKLSERIQHWLLIVSFSYLALTGFALKFPDSFLAWLAGSDEAIRRTGHRVAGLFLIVLGIYHVAVSLATGQGRKLLADLLPGRQDLKDLLANLHHFLRRHAAKPKFGRFGYPEKIEYWAVFWGTAVMGVTGLAIWLKVEVTRFFPRWIIEVSTTIHYYEAILAVLAIVVWHFYHVIFDPDIYPSNTAWWTGRVPEKWYRRKHPNDPSPEPAVGPDQEPNGNPANEEREEGGGSPPGPV